MKIYLARHASSFLDEEGVLSSNFNIGLSPLGESQAGKLASRLLKEPIGFAYSSPSKRSERTSNAYFQLSSVKPYTMVELKGIDFDIFEGTRKKCYLDTLQGRNKFQNLRERVKVLDEAIKNYQGEAIIVFAERETNMAILLNILNKSDESWIDFREMANASLSLVEVDSDGAKKLDYFNDTTHLT